MCLENRRLLASTTVEPVSLGKLGKTRQELPRFSCNARDKFFRTGIGSTTRTPSLHAEPSCSRLGGGESLPWYLVQKKPWGLMCEQKAV